MENLGLKIDKIILDNKKLGHINRQFDDLRLGSIGAIEGMIDLLNENKDFLEGKWKTDKLFSELYSMLEVLNTRI